MGETVLIVGGVRSGKSRLAAKLAAEREPVTYVATATVDPTDAEMLARVEAHRAARPGSWTTREAARDLPKALEDLAREQGQEGSVVIDCVTLWVTNLMLGLGGGPALDDPAIIGQVDAAARAASGCARVIWVSNEVGFGGVAAHSVARRFADLLGTVNQRLASACGVVHLCVAGVPIRIK